jgi:localization factor PodJL
MTSGAPWSVKGIDPKAREIAKDLARRSGMTLGEWLNHVIYDDEAETPAGAPSRRVAAAAQERPISENRAPRRSGGDDLHQVLAALQGLSERFDASSQEQAETSARFEQAMAELKADQSAVAQRLETVEKTGGSTPGKAEALRALEGALTKVAVHLNEGENRHREAMSILRQEMGEEMQRVAAQVNQQVLEGENRSADAIAQVGAEVSRVATAVEQRLRRADDSQAVALEKLGGEIARITERLSERIAAAERRASSSIEEVGEQMARVTDRIHQRQERNESELVERMRLSEERAARHLEDARQTIERRLQKMAAASAEIPVPTAFTERWSPVDVEEEVEVDGAQAAPSAEVPAFLREPALTVEAVEEAGASIEDLLHAEDEEEGDAPATLGLQAYTPVLTAEAAFTAPDDAAAMAAVAQAITEDHAVLEAHDEDEQGAETAGYQAESLRPSARDLILEARANASAERVTFRPAAEDDEDEVVFPDLISRRPRPNNSMRGVLLAGGVVSALGLASAGYVYLHPEVVSGVGGAAAPVKAIPVGPPSAAPTPAPATQAAVALAPAATPKDDTADLDAMFREASAKVDAGDPMGVAPLRTAANLGWAPAQRRLGKLFEDGGAGVAKDPVEGRRWTMRAAANGDARGMHNLGLDYYEGVGGVKNAVVAAQWFSRAAQLGLRDSQYNLARFYEAGLGVTADLPSAYKWYLIAGRAGDTEASARAQVLKAKLPADQAARAEALAGAFQPDRASPPASLAASLRGANPKQLALAQRALAKLGYYKGADDGAPSQPLGEAIQAFQRDRGLAANGQLSPELVQTFANISQ